MTVSRRCNSRPSWRETASTWAVLAWLCVVLLLAPSARAQGLLDPLVEDDAAGQLERDASELRAVLTQARELEALLKGDRRILEHWDIRDPATRDNHTLLAEPLAHMYAASIVAADRAMGTIQPNYTLSDFSPYNHSELPVVPDLLLNVSFPKPAIPAPSPPRLTLDPTVVQAARNWPLPPRSYLNSFRGVWHSNAWSLSPVSIIQQPKPVPSKPPKPYKPAGPEPSIHPKFPAPRPDAPVDHLDQGRKEQVARQQHDLLSLLFQSSKSFPGSYGGINLTSFRHILGGQVELDLQESYALGTAAGVVPVEGSLTLGVAPSDWKSSSIPACGRHVPPSSSNKDGPSNHSGDPLDPMPDVLEFDVFGVHVRPHGLLYAQVLTMTDPDWIDPREALKMIPLPGQGWNEVRDYLANHTSSTDEDQSQAALEHAARQSSAWGLWSRVLQSLHAILISRVDHVTRRLRDEDTPPPRLDDSSSSGNHTGLGSNATTPFPSPPHALDPLWSHNCSFHLYAHMQPVGQADGTNAVRKAEHAMRNPRGWPHVHLPESPQLRGVLWSPECQLLMRLGEVEPDLSDVLGVKPSCPPSKRSNVVDMAEWNARTRMTGKLDLLRPVRALRYTSGVVILLLFLCLLVTRSMDRSTSPAALARLAWPTWAMFCITDVSFFVTHLVVAIFFQGQRDTAAWYATAFGFAILFIALEYQHTLNIWHLHHVNGREQAARERAEAETAANVTTAEASTAASAAAPPDSQQQSSNTSTYQPQATEEQRTEGTEGTTPAPPTPSTPSRSPVWIVMRMVQIIGKVLRRHPVRLTLLVIVPILATTLNGMALATTILLLVHSFWLPQIWRNVRRHQRGALERRFIILISLTRMLLPTYFLVYPSNYAGFSPHPWLALLIIGYITFQAVLLLGQSLLGPTFFLSNAILCRMGMAPQQRWNFFVAPTDVVSLLQSRGQSFNPPKDGKVEVGDCPICFEAIVVPLAPEEPSTGREEDLEAGASDDHEDVEHAGLLDESPQSEHSHVHSHAHHAHRGQHRQSSPASRSRSHTYPSGTGKLSRAFRFAHLTSDWCRRTIVATLSWKSALARNRRTELMVTPCHHVFHTDCLSEWLLVKSECPQCRCPLPPV